MIDIKDFQQIEMKIGEIISAQDVPNSDRLYVLGVDVGGRQIQLVAGLKPHYQEDELKGKKIVVVTNLKPATIKGVTSEGMLLAAINNDRISLLTVDRDIPVGSSVA